MAATAAPPTGTARQTTTGSSGEPTGGGDVPGRSWKAVVDGGRAPSPSRSGHLLGILPGEGIGPEIIACARGVLEAIVDVAGVCIDLQIAAPGGSDETPGGASPGELLDFSGEVFGRGGAVLAGPVGGRFVYELRNRFDLFCKLVPIRPIAELAGAGPLRPEHLVGIDVLIVRENSGGEYHGRWSRAACPEGGERAEHSFSYTDREVRRVVEVAAHIARSRRGRLAVVVKLAGIPAISELWREVATAVAGRIGVEVITLDVGYAVDLVIRHPHELDVIVAPNLFGDLVADCAGVLMGSRGVSFSASLSADGAAVFQTNHGRAGDLAGTDSANPAAQLLALAMLLSESFGLSAEAELIERALAAVWAAGWRTPDVAVPGSRVIGTREMGHRVEAAVRGARAAR